MDDSGQQFFDTTNMNYRKSVEYTAAVKRESLQPKKGKNWGKDSNQTKEKTHLKVEEDSQQIE